MWYFSEVTPENELISSLPVWQNALTVSCLVIGTAQQINDKLMHPFEKFRQNLLVKFYSLKDFSFLTLEMKQRKNCCLGFAVVQNNGSLKPCHVLLKQSSENVFVFK